jgi:hypothetical protein
MLIEMKRGNSMKLEKETIDILKNFQKINPSIIIREGNTLMTQRSGVIVARSKVSDTFPRTAPIADLQKFLALLSLGKDECDIDFGETCMTISHDNYQSLLAYSPESLIDSPPVGKNIRLKSKDVQFTLKEDVWTQVSSAMGIMSFTEFAFVGENGKLSIQALSTRISNGSSDTYSAYLGETDKTFHCILNQANMKLIPGDYDVTIDKNGLVHFKGELVEYWIVMSAKSTFE